LIRRLCYSFYNEVKARVIRGLQSSNVDIGCGNIIFVDFIGFRLYVVWWDCLWDWLGLD
jgi:hypothetical protein